MGLHHRSVFPRCEGRTTRSGPRHATVHRVTDSGQRVVVSRWPSGQSRSSVEVSADPMHRSKGSEIISLYHTCQGGAHGFRYRDWRDWSTHPEANKTPDFSRYGQNGATPHYTYMGLATAGQTKIQLRKSYGSTVANARFRDITKPIPPGQPDHIFVLSANFSTFYLLGYNVTCDFDTGECRLTTPLVGGENLYGCFTFDIATRFDDSRNGLRISARGRDTFEFPSMALRETGIDLAGEGADEIMPGGYKDVTYDGTIDFEDGFFQRITGHSTGALLNLPDCRDLGHGTYGNVVTTTTGGPYFAIQNGHATNTLDIRGKDGNSLTPALILSGGQVASFYLVANTAAEATWRSA